MQKKKKVLRNRSKILALIVLFGIAFGVGCALPQLSRIWADEEAGGPAIEKGEPVNILVLGIDARPEEKMTRSDTMMLVHAEPETGKVVVISIPRDTKVRLEGKENKINSANAIGGPEAACKAVEKLLDVKVDYYVLTNFKGFEKIIDILGGVTIDVESNMYNRYEGINLRKGDNQHLNGKKALGYVRFRDDALGDISRTQRQQKFLKALADEMLQTKTIFKIPALIPELKANVQTNMGTKTMLKLAQEAADFSKENLITQTLPGYFYDDPDTGASYWIVDEKEAKKMIDTLLSGRKVDTIKESPFPVPPKKGRDEKPDETPSAPDIGSDTDKDDPVKDPEDPWKDPPDDPIEEPVDPGTYPPDEPDPPQDPDQQDHLGPEGY